MRGLALTSHEVRGLLARRRFQLRRPVRTPGVHWVVTPEAPPPHAPAGASLAEMEGGGVKVITGPFSAPGRLMWAKEAFRVAQWSPTGVVIDYLADGGVREIRAEDLPPEDSEALARRTDLRTDRRWQSPAIAPRWSSRMRLPVHRLSVHPGFDATQLDARLEGYEQVSEIWKNALHPQYRFWWVAELGYVSISDFVQRKR